MDDKIVKESIDDTSTQVPMWQMSYLFLDAAHLSGGNISKFHRSNGSKARIRCSRIKIGTTLIHSISFLTSLFLGGGI